MLLLVVPPATAADPIQFHQVPLSGARDPGVGPSVPMMSGSSVRVGPHSQCSFFQASLLLAVALTSPNTTSVAHPEPNLNRAGGHAVNEGANAISLSDRVHIFVRPDAMERLIAFFTSIVGLDAPIHVELPGRPLPILVFTFPNGASLSVEFTNDAPDEASLNRGAWLELVADDSSELERRIIQSRLPRVDYAGSDGFYFQAPGGQVMRIASAETGANVPAGVEPTSR